jgi:hypothetical protein
MAGLLENVKVTSSPMGTLRAARGADQHRGGQFSPPPSPRARSPQLLLQLPTLAQSDRMELLVPTGSPFAFYCFSLIVTWSTSVAL